MLGLVPLIKTPYECTLEVYLLFSSYLITYCDLEKKKSNLTNQFFY